MKWFSLRHIFDIGATLEGNPIFKSSYYPPKLPGADTTLSFI